MDDTQKEYAIMPKMVSVSEAKNRLSAMMQWAVENRDEVIVESRGEPKAAILPYGEYQEFVLLREAARRQKALQQLEAIATRVQAKNANLSAEEAQQLADEISQESVRRMEKEGKVQFRP